MMTADEILREANIAFHEGRTRDWCRWHALLHAIWLSEGDNARGVQEACERLIGRQIDDAQFDYQNEADAQGVDIKELTR